MSNPPPPPSTQFLASLGKDKYGNTEKPEDDESLTIGQSSSRVFTGIICAIIVPLVLWVSGSALETFLLPETVCVGSITTPIKAIMCDSEKVTEKIDEVTKNKTKWKPPAASGFINSVMGLVREHTTPKVTTLASILVATVLIGTGLLYWIIGAAGWGQFLKETWNDDHQIIAVLLLFLCSFLAVGVLTLETYLRFIWHCITIIKDQTLKPPDKEAMYFIGFISSLFIWFSVMSATQGLGGSQVAILIYTAICCIWATYKAASGAASGPAREAAAVMKEKMATKGTAVYNAVKESDL